MVRTSYQFELYQQANKRLHRPGQKKTVLIHHILMKDTYDYRVLDEYSRRRR